ncbi:hypothetical protein SBD_2262 [Streptomyces bottropensis ATCC 25435]|uniref:Uncharacterized protein n=1 Tax=Streptomyces bottropensis ATCC 25435 TaxID=1054862 RepID=M3DHW9_9ACTN|nr:hypothetical protein SBD_2262 [Streptomyces bottropensis ATCC 25435]
MIRPKWGTTTLLIGALRASGGDPRIAPADSERIPCSPRERR